MEALKRSRSRQKHGALSVYPQKINDDFPETFGRWPAVVCLSPFKKQDKKDNLEENKPTQLHVKHPRVLSSSDRKTINSNESLKARYYG